LQNDLGEMTLVTYFEYDVYACDLLRMTVQDMKKFGGPNRLRQKCRLRQCRNYVSYVLLLLIDNIVCITHNRE